MAAHKKWLFGGIAACVLLFVLGFMLVVNPARNQAASIQSQAETTERNNIQLAAKVSQLQQQSSEVPVKLEEIAEVQRKMPSEIKQPELVRTIEQEAISAGVDLTGIAPGTPLTLEGSTSGTVALPASITAEGRYANVKTFVDNLERLERAFLIKSIDVTVAEEALDSFVVSLEGDFFSLPEGTLDTPAKAGDPAAAAPAPAATAAAKAPRAAAESNDKADTKSDKRGAQRQDNKRN